MNDSNHDNDPEAKLHAHVMNCLKQSGYPLEMRTAAMFRGRGFMTDSARYYVEIDGKTLREIDVVAQGAGRNTVYPKKPWVHFFFVIECKSSRDKPWVAFLSDDRFVRDEDVFEAMPHQFIAPGAAQGDPLSFAPSDLRGLHQAKLLYSTDPYAYSIVVVDQSNESPPWAYNALRQVLSGVDGLTRDLDPGPTRPQLRIFIPIVVTSAPLFTCRLDTAGGLNLARRDKVLLVARLRPSVALTAVWIVQESYLGTLAIEARQTIEAVHFA